MAVSPFISPEEKEIKKKIEEIGGAVILIVNNPLPPAPWKPSRHDFYQCAKGELLILAPVGRSFGDGGDNISREACLEMNELAEYIAATPLR